jgi:hypothetical protein
VGRRGATVIGTPGPNGVVLPLGEAFGQLGEARDEHDPGRVLTPSYEVF